MNFFTKVLQWLGLNLATILGVIQTIVKFVKEIATGLINLAAALILLFPKIGMDGFQAGVKAVRDAFNAIDEWIESIKGNLIP